MKKNEEHVVLTLDDHKKYVLVNNVILDHIEYFYLAEIDHPTNLMFCKVNGNQLSRVTDEQIVQKLVMQIYQENHGN